VIGLHLRVPLACWRKAHAREFIETELLPPPATSYGALLSLVGETERQRHIGCRVTAGLLNEPEISTVLRTLWRIKDRKTPQGTGENARPDFQQLVIGADLVLWCDSSEEEPSGTTLEQRVESALRRPASIERFGGWSLGESTHLIDDAWVIDDHALPRACRTFVLDSEGRMTLPVWVDHVGTTGTRYAVGDLRPLTRAPTSAELPRIEPPPVRAGKRKG
jgi:CRISPR-associated protein Cas5t